MSNSNGDSVSYYAIVTDRKRRRKDKPFDEPEGKFTAFATNTSWINVLKYGKRWDIETGFRMIENMRARTPSGSVDARVFYFLYSVMVFNLWVVANVILTQGARWDGKSVLPQESV